MRVLLKFYGTQANKSTHPPNSYHPTGDPTVVVALAAIVDVDVVAVVVSVVAIACYCHCCFGCRR